MVDRKEDQSTQFRDTSSGNFEQAAKTATQTQVDPSLADAQTVAQSLGVDLNTGLSQAEAKRRLDKYGPNELASAPPVPKWKKFLEQFKDPLVYLLLAATGISLVAWFIERANAVPGAEGRQFLRGADELDVLKMAVRVHKTGHRVRKAAKHCRSTPSSSC